MPLVDAFTLQVADGVLLGVGGLYALRAAAGFRRSLLEQRDPLADAPPPARPVSPLLAFGLLLSYYLLMASGIPQGLAAIAGGQPASSLPRVIPPGEPLWFRVLIAAGLCQVLLALILWRVLRRRPLEALASAPPRPYPAWRCIAVALSAVLVCHLQVYGIGLVWRWFDPTVQPPEHDVLAALQGNTWGHAGVALMVVAAVIIAPWFEELLYRGVILGAGLTAFRARWLSIVFSGLFFGAMHMVQPQAILPLATFGVILGYVRLASGRLWPCVLIHALFNGRSMLLAILNPELIRGW